MRRRSASGLSAKPSRGKQPDKLLASSVERVVAQVANGKASPNITGGQVVAPNAEPLQGVGLRQLQWAAGGPPCKLGRRIRKINGSMMRNSAERIRKMLL